MRKKDFFFIITGVIIVEILIFMISLVFIALTKDLTFYDKAILVVILEFFLILVLVLILLFLWSKVHKNKIVLGPATFFYVSNEFHEGQQIVNYRGYQVIEQEARYLQFIDTLCDYKLTKIDLFNISPTGFMVKDFHVILLSFEEFEEVSKVNLAMFEKLENLVIGKIPLKPIPESLFHLNNLNHLALYSCEITEVPTEIVNLTKLRILNLSKNKITTFPCFLSGLSNLDKLELEGNEIEDVPDCIANFTNLQILRLNNNRIVTLPVLEGKLPNMKTLFLSNNPLDDNAKVEFKKFSRWLKKKGKNRE